jgi:hypothetical protein
LFINNSCHAGGILPVFKRYGLVPKKNLVLAAAKKEEYAFDNIFLLALIESYREGNPFRKRVITYVKREHEISCDQQQLSLETTTEAFVQHPQRCGAELDYLLYRKLR